MSLKIIRNSSVSVLYLLCLFGGYSFAQSTGEKSIPGYTLGEKKVSPSPVSLKEFESLKKAVLFSAEDEKYLKMSHDVLKDQTEEILDVWYNFVGTTPELAYYFGNQKDGKLDARYLGAVRKRFKVWILDTAKAEYDQKWLDYQQEIGLRHNKKKKNKTDNVKSVKQINFRYIPALVYPITATLKPFLAKKGHSAEDVEKMHQAWVKSVLLQSILWSHPYIKKNQF